MCGRPVAGPQAWSPTLRPNIVDTSSQLHTDLQCDGNLDLPGRLRQGDIDVAIADWPMQHDGLTRVDLFIAEIRAYAQPNSPWCRKRKLSYDDLAEAPFVATNG